MSQLERVSIVYDIKVKFQTYKDTMRKFRVGNGTIRWLIHRVNKNKDYLKEIQSKLETKEDKIQKVTKTAQTLLDLDQNITRATFVKYHCELYYEIKTPIHQVRQVLRRHIGLNYKLCPKLSFQGNGEQNLVLRQRFAIEML